MKYSLLALFSVAALSASAAPVGIPYNISCNGTQVGNPSVKLTLTTKNTDELTLARHVSDDRMDVDFNVTKISSLQGFNLTANGLVYFAGSGSMVGSLALPDGRTGTWTETTTVFNEATGQTEVGEVKYNVDCMVAQ